MKMDENLSSSHKGTQPQDTQIVCLLFLYEAIHFPQSIKGAAAEIRSLNGTSFRRRK